MQHGFDQCVHNIYIVFGNGVVSFAECVMPTWVKKKHYVRREHYELYLLLHFKYLFYVIYYLSNEKQNLESLCIWLFMHVEYALRTLGENHIIIMNMKCGNVRHFGPSSLSTFVWSLLRSLAIVLTCAHDSCEVRTR